MLRNLSEKYERWLKAMRERMEDRFLERLTISSDR